MKCQISNFSTLQFVARLDISPSDDKGQSTPYRDTQPRVCCVYVCVTKELCEEKGVENGREREKGDKPSTQCMQIAHFPS